MFFLGLPFAREALGRLELLLLEFLGNQIALVHASGISLGCADIQPNVRLDEVSLHALTRPVHGAQIVLGLGVILIRGSTKPARGLRIILRHAFTVVVEQSEVDLGWSVAAVG